MSAARTDGPLRPRLGASLACFRHGKALIARRGRAPNRGLWSLPGGRVAFGETAAGAAAREFFEETSARADVLGLADVVEIIERAGDGGPGRHFVVLAYAGRLVSGEPAPGREAAEIAWVGVDDLDGYDVTPGLGRVIRLAAEIAA